MKQQLNKNCKKKNIIKMIRKNNKKNNTKNKK